MRIIQHFQSNNSGDFYALNYHTLREDRTHLAASQPRRTRRADTLLHDLPLEEASPLQQAAQRHGLSLIFLIPPTTSNERIAFIARNAASGQGSSGSFIYCVSLSGVTGARTALPTSLQAFISRVREHSKEYH